MSIEETPSPPLSQQEAPRVLLELREVTCGYRKKQVLENAKLKLWQGDRLAIIGDNGQGKSTLLKLLLGLLLPKAGHVKRHLSQHHIAYVPQHSTRDYLLPMPVRDFVALGLVGAHPPDTLNIETALKRVHLEEHLHQDITTLSGGQFQRAVLARALVRSPKLLFLDEPTTGLDQKATQEFMDELHHQNRDKDLSYAMVIHDFRHLKENFDRVAWVHSGDIFSSTISEALNKPEFQAFTGLTP